MNQNGVSLIEFNKFFKSLGAWASGTACHYRPSTLISSEGNLDISGLPVGMVIFLFRFLLSSISLILTHLSEIQVTSSSLCFRC